MNAETIAWLELLARDVVDRQLAEAARLDAKARELLGFVGVVLGLLAAAISQVGSLNYPEAAFFDTAAAVSVVTLVWAGLRAARPVVDPERYSAPDHQTLVDLWGDPSLPSEGPHVAQVVAFTRLVADAGHNSVALTRFERQLSAAYGWFAAGLVAAGLTVLTLVLALV